MRVQPTIRPRRSEPAGEQRATPRDGESELLARFRRIRRQTSELCAPLEIEDYVAQSMIEASPVRWHIAHTTWFFEEFLLGPHLPGYRVFHPAYRRLFNSYYNAVGERTPRGERGLLSRPPVREIVRYRASVEEAVEAMLRAAGDRLAPRAAEIIELGLNHEQQHQELILTDLKHLLSFNPLRPTYREEAAIPSERAGSGPGAKRAPGANSGIEETGRAAAAFRWIPFAGGLLSIGHEGPGFVFDNETPRHQILLRPYALADRPVTNREYLTFMDEGGYRRAELWLDEGWATAQTHRWEAPLYWERGEGTWQVFTLGGLRPIDWEEPVCHVSFYEADAFARWAGARLPLEAEWEVAAASSPTEGNLLESGRFHPASGSSEDERETTQRAGRTLRQLYGDVWEWTASPYRPYPGYAPAPGALGEYNGKFMVSQFVLRGGSCVTPESHIRSTYRNFFYPQARWQFSGVRLAREVS